MDVTRVSEEIAESRLMDGLERLLTFVLSEARCPVCDGMDRCEIGCRAMIHAATDEEMVSSARRIRRAREALSDYRRCVARRFDRNRSA